MKVKPVFHSAIFFAREQAKRECDWLLMSSGLSLANQLTGGFVRSTRLYIWSAFVFIAFAVVITEVDKDSCFARKKSCSEMRDC